MKLDAVRVVGYRSAEDVTLRDIGSFNVLIGKNNCGKSTLLAAIQAFFRSVAGGSVVSTTPMLGRRVDFSNSVPKGPIRITPTLSLQLAERDALMRDIASDASQMKNAIDGIDPSLKLEVTVAFPRAAKRHSYLEAINLVDGTSGASRLLLQINEAAAGELVVKFQTNEETRDLSSQVKRLLEAIDADDFRRMNMREAPDARVLPPSFYLRRFETNSLTNSIFESAVRNSATFPEFQSNLAAGRDKLLACLIHQTRDLCARGGDQELG